MNLWERSGLCTPSLFFSFAQKTSCLFHHVYHSCANSKTTVCYKFCVFYIRWKVQTREFLYLWMSSRETWPWRKMRRSLLCLSSPFSQLLFRGCSCVAVIDPVLYGVLAQHFKLLLGSCAVCCTTFCSWEIPPWFDAPPSEMKFSVHESCKLPQNCHFCRE